MKKASHIKKAELHVHLEGTITPLLAKRLAKRHGSVFPENLMAEDQVSYHSHDFLHFLNVYDTLSSLIKTPEDYYDLTLDYLRQSSEEHVLYTEMMYSPDHAERMTSIPSKHHLEAIQQAVDDAEHAFGIVGRVLITFVRHFGVDSAERALNHAIAYRPPCVVGVGIGGDELGFPLPLFKSIFDKAHQEGFHCTAHVGEFGSPDTIAQAIKDFPLKRIGHGVQAIYSEAVIEMLKEHEITLELCPSSNVKFGLFESLKKHPLAQFLEQGVLISLNSDDPPFIPTTVGQEYDRIQTVFDFDDATMHSITRMALNAAFVDKATREQLLARLESVAIK